jgi:hypothetical protein
MRPAQHHKLVLSIYLSARGFAFVLFEGPLAPYDWGIHEVRGRSRNARCIRLVERVLERYEPDALVIQDTSASGTRRAPRIQKLNLAIGEIADAWGVPIYAYSRVHVRQCFAAPNFPTKQTIAEAIARHVPAFERYLPPPRKPWDSEHARMGLFDAAALALTFFHSLTDGTPVA